MNIKTTAHIILLFSFSFLQCMEITKPDSNSITDIGLQKLIKEVNKSSLHIVNFVRERTQYHGISLTSDSIGPLLQLDQKGINDIFLATVEDDDLRPLMLSMGADIKARTKENRNCLWYIKKPELLTELIDKGADVDAIDKDENTPLIHLVQYYIRAPEDLAAARVLLARSTNHTTNPERYASLLYHINNYNTNSNLRFEIAKLLCEYKANLNVQDYIGRTPLITVIQEGISELVELFLQYGANKEINTPNKYDEYPLHIAMEKEEYFYHSRTRKKIIPKIVILLLQHGANPNIAYRDGKTMPLHVAVDRAQPDIIKELIQYGAEKHHTNHDGNTAYDLAQKYACSTEILDLLYVNTQQKKESISHDENKDPIVIVENQPDTPQDSLTRASSCHIQ